MVGGASSNEGKLEYCYYGAWSPICSSFHDEEATVACKQLGFTNLPYSKHIFNTCYYHAPAKINFGKIIMHNRNEWFGEFIIHCKKIRIAIGNVKGIKCNCMQLCNLKEFSYLKCSSYMCFVIFLFEKSTFSFFIEAAFFTDVQFGRLSNLSLFNYIYCSSSSYQNSLSSCNLYDSSCRYSVLKTMA